MSNIKVLESSSLDFESVDLHIPELTELANILETGLLKDFSTAKVRVLEKSPDLREAPYFLSAPGFGKSDNGPSTCVIDIGGPPYLLPFPERSRFYSLADIARKTLGYGRSSAFMIGAGAGPWPRVGPNCEGIYDVLVNEDGSINTNGIVTSKVDVTTGGQVVEKAPKDDTNCSLLANILCTEGKQNSPVLEVTCSRRTGSRDPITCLRSALDSTYTPSRTTVALGGTFLLETGKAKIHVMPDFSKTALNTDDDVNNWLKFYEVEAPFCSVGTLVSRDAGLDLRPQHFHGRTTDRKFAGHYHYDVTPYDVSYRAILVPAEKLIRIDRPKITHQVGRD